MKNIVLMTQYFYPIEKGGTSKFFGGIYFDNPRTSEEIEYVQQELKKMNKKDNFFVDEYNESKYNIGIKNIIQIFCDKNSNKNNVANYSNDISENEDAYLSLAKMWVIVRCDKILNDKDTDKCTYSEEIKEDTAFFNNLVNFDRIKKLLMFLSFMLTDEYSSNRSILVNDEHGSNTGLEHHSFFGFMHGLYTLEDYEKDDLNYDHFSEVLDSYTNYINLIGDRYVDEKFLFICDTIEYISDLRIRSPRMYLLGLVGLIEMLLTHNPDKSMYNIEDSISKQYRKKLKYVIYKNMNNINLETLEDELKTSYNIRSDIAHGNFGKSSKKNMDKLYQIYNYNKNARGIDYVDYDLVIDTLNSNLIKYVKILLELYLKNPTELELLKDI